MTGTEKISNLEVGYNIPAEIGMTEGDIQTPCLLIDLEAFEKNVERMRYFCAESGVSLRAHGKMHKSADVARYQIKHGGALGICCQKVSEAEAFARAGIEDILITNQVRDARKLQRLANLPKLGARIICCVDDLDNVGELSKAATSIGTSLECLVELDCGAGRCGVTGPVAALEIAAAIDAADGLIFSGIQAYNGNAQHLQEFNERKRAYKAVETVVIEVIEALKQKNLHCQIVSGGGTGSFEFEATSGVFTEIQCGSYAFMDAAYGRILDKSGQQFSGRTFDHALFILTSVMSHTKPEHAICDAGLKVQSVDSGLPTVFDQQDVTYTNCSDEHGTLEDPQGKLQINDKLRLVPGHCDPTCNLHDWYVCVRNGSVEALWPITARGMAL